MPKSLKNIKKNLNTREHEQRKNVLRIVDQNPMLQLGVHPSLTRNQKLEKTWKTLLSDPPVAHSDVNQWRSSADVRPSSFPFCGRRYALERLGLTMPSDFRVQGNFYTEIGKAVHYVSQNAFAQTGRLWGFWLCARPTCADRQARKFFSESPGFFPRNQTCPTCGASKFEYEELTVADGKIGLRGHVDGVIVYKNFSSVLEIKTAGDKKVTGLLSLSDTQISELFRSEAPWVGYWHQASTYAALLRTKYPSLPPIKYVDYIIYSRDNPSTIASFRLSVPEDNSWWGELRCRILQAQEARDKGIVPKGFATTQSDIDALPTCRWCSHKDVCLEPEGKLEFNADALYDQDANDQLVEVLNKERARWAELFVETSLMQPTSKPQKK